MSKSRFSFRPIYAAAALALLGFTTTDASAQSIDYRHYGQIPAAERPAPQADGDWDVTLGAGAFVKPEYEGGDEYEVIPLPFVDIRYKDRYYLNPWRGLGVDMYKDENFTFGTALGWDFGRDEDDADHLRGLGDVDGGADVKLYGEVDLGLVDLEVEAAQNIGGHGGFTVEPSVTYSTRTGASTFVSVGAHTTYASDDYMGSFFDVDAGQSAGSGLRQYDADGGFKDIGVSANVRHMLTEHWFLNGMARYDLLIGDASDSPVSETDSQPSLIIGAGYRF